MNTKIDVTYDMRLDSNNDDPDGYSLTLAKCHQKIWSKKLPNGRNLELEIDIDDDKRYIFKGLVDGKEIIFSSDIIATTYSDGWSRFPISKEIIPNIPEKIVDEFDLFAHTIGAFIIFPKRMKNGNTINQARGINSEIYDRFDLTLECIRRQYSGIENPLTETLTRYADYFNLFNGFKEYCQFFLLQDLVSNDYKEVRFHLPFNGFEKNPLPKSLIEYASFRESCIEFVKLRNKRIFEYYESTNA